METAAIPGTICKWQTSGMLFYSLDTVCSLEWFISKGSGLRGFLSFLVKYLTCSEGGFVFGRMVVVWKFIFPGEQKSCNLNFLEVNSTVKDRIPTRRKRLSWKLEHASYWQKCTSHLKMTVFIISMWYKHVLITSGRNLCKFLLLCDSVDFQPELYNSVKLKFQSSFRH